MTSIKPRFGNAPPDVDGDYELESVVLDGERVVSYQTSYLGKLPARRLLVDLVHTLDGDDGLGDDLVPRAFLDRLDALTEEQVEEARSMGAGTVARVDAVNEVREAFGLDTLPRSNDEEDP